MKIAVQGYGSIGQRHVAVLQALGHDVAVVSRRELGVQHEFRDLEQCIADWKPQYFIIANETSEHESSYISLCKLGYSGLVLLEKPAFHHPIPIDAHESKGTFVGYNLRFHPILQRAKSLLIGQQIYALNASCGQSLDTWRGTRNHLHTYSAIRQAGGGVLRDLSHEIDYVQWLVGPIVSVTCMADRKSQLTVDSEDLATIMGLTERQIHVSIQLNYLNKIPLRQIQITTAEFMLAIDLIKGRISVNSESIELPCERNQTYSSMHQSIMGTMGDQPSEACPLKEGVQVLDVIEACERSSRDRKWVDI